MVTSNRAARAVLAFTLGFALSCAVHVSRPESPARVRAPHAQAADDLMPPLPDSVFSKNGWTRIHREPQPYYCGRVLAWGCYTYATRTLVVVTGLSRWDEWAVLEHEKVHMALGDAHLTAQERGEDPRYDDAIADVISSQRMLERLAPGMH